MGDDEASGRDSITAASTSICGISTFEPAGASCAVRCGLGGRGKRAAWPPSHGVPGGAACCGHKGGLASCPRAWD